ncbi:MAG: NUDIX domain-containing protein [Chloroflexota bacterium]
MSISPTDPPAAPWIRVGAYAIVTDESSRILLCRIAPGYPAAGRWTLPGGGVDHGEHPDDAVLRELREETGLAGTRERVVMVWSGLIEKPASRPGPLHWIAILYRVTAEPGELVLEVDGSTETAAWFELDEVGGIPHVDLVDGAVRTVRDELAARG